MTLRKMFLTFIILSIGNPSLLADTLTVACSPWKPYYYQENKTIKGSSYEIARAVFERADIKAKFVVHPWKRAYESGLNAPNYLVACLGKLPEREKLFHWIGPVAKTTFYNFYKKESSDISLSSLEDIKNHSVGVLRGSLTEEFLKKSSHKHVHPIATAKQLIMMLEAGRFDLILEAGNVIEHESTLAKIKPETFELALIGFGVSINMALSKQTPMETVQRLQEAYKGLDSEGKIVLP